MLTIAPRQDVLSVPSEPTSTASSKKFFTWSTTILGPLTETWTVPPSCTVVFAKCSTCKNGWAAQSCAGDTIVTDNVGCWPPRTSGAHTPPLNIALLGWGIYTPASVCPEGYSSACSYDGASRTGDFEFDFSPRETEAAIGCCPLYVNPEHRGTLRANKIQGLYLRQSQCANLFHDINHTDSSHPNCDVRVWL
ncbi:hypothetical protein GGR52DRAFT_229805 [Hypoxylon sp. FL1284]|nr:hypothetical protein GGR52DRAFT_229805 [Hypoxylon sp. FL1284]